MNTSHGPASSGVTVEKSKSASSANRDEMTVQTKTPIKMRQNRIGDGQIIPVTIDQRYWTGRKKTFVKYPWGTLLAAPGVRASNF